jgi:hypothetical protein
MRMRRPKYRHNSFAFALPETGPTVSKTRAVTGCANETVTFLPLKCCIQSADEGNVLWSYAHFLAVNVVLLSLTYWLPWNVLALGRWLSSRSKFVWDVGWSFYSRWVKFLFTFPACAVFVAVAAYSVGVTLQSRELTPAGDKKVLCRQAPEGGQFNHTSEYVCVDLSWVILPWRLRNN